MGSAKKKKDGVKMRAGVKVGTGCLHVCVLSSLLMNDKSLSEPRGILHIPQAYLL